MAIRKRITKARREREARESLTPSWAQAMEHLVLLSYRRMTGDVMRYANVEAVARLVSKANSGQDLTPVGAGIVYALNYVLLRDYKEKLLTRAVAARLYEYLYSQEALERDWEAYSYWQGLEWPLPAKVKKHPKRKRLKKHK